jgi:hypothetical protein
MNFENLKTAVPSCNAFYGSVPEEKAYLLEGNLQASLGNGTVVYCFPEPVKGLEAFLLNESNLQTVSVVIEPIPELVIEE